MNSFYNLITGHGVDRPGITTMEKGRVMGRHTHDTIRARFILNEAINYTALEQLPCLFIPEMANCANQLTRIGRISNITELRREVQFEVHYDETVPALDCNWIWNNGQLLGFEGHEWQKSRSEWAVNPGNLHELLLRHLPFRRFGGQSLRIPEMDITRPNLVVAMMPFSPGFEPVYETIINASTDAGMECQRADDIWRHDVVMDEVVELIAEGKIIVCDISGRNANVFYETGIAHCLGKSVILITQSDADVPFDLRHRRFLTYLPNAEGLNTMRQQLSQRILQLR